MVLQVRVIENHQNGKDTHVRGLQVFSLDERAGMRKYGTRTEEEGGMNGNVRIGWDDVAGEEVETSDEVVIEPEWTSEVELR